MIRFCNCVAPNVKTRPSGTKYCGTCGLNLAPEPPPTEDKP